MLSVQPNLFGGFLAEKLGTDWHWWSDTGRLFRQRDGCERCTRVVTSHEIKTWLCLESFSSKDHVDFSALRADFQA